ncbi:MAG: 1-acyl-sn-glycerol-3-phosphate acyltransferase [Rhodobacteraceae bacterium]|nr:1-acyl-sn-glycerol-3-phosphate acyltransferase [Paracoccaceae bacterium]
MGGVIEIPVWLAVLAGIFALVALLDKLLIPSVRWYFRKRFEGAVARLNTRLQLQIQPFKLTRRKDLIDRLAHDPEIMQAVATESAKSGEPAEVVAQRARRYAREIVPHFSAFAYFGFAARVARWVSKALYRVRIGLLDEAAMAKINSDSTVVFVMNHRSNMDYVLVTYLAAERSALSYAVGEWARVWPLQGFIRSMGAYFIRRKSHNPLYRSVLSRYVQMATEGGVAQAIFPEGGLSRDGRLGEAKLGLLSYIVKGFDADGLRDVAFVPVGLNYDRVLEDRMLLAAQGEKKAKFKSGPGAALRFIRHHLWLRITGKYHRFGYACVSFSKPLSLRGYLAGAEGTKEEQIAALGKLLMEEIGKVVPVLPVSLIATVMLQAGSLSRIEAKKAAHQLLKKYTARGVYSHIPREDEDYAVDVGLRMLEMRHILHEKDGAYTINEENRHLLEYYANAIAHLG